MRQRVELGKVRVSQVEMPVGCKDWVSSSSPQASLSLPVICSFSVERLTGSGSGVLAGQETL